MLIKSVGPVQQPSQQRAAARAQATLHVLHHMAVEHHDAHQRGEVVAVGESVQRAREPQVQLVAIQRHRFHLLEHLREVHGRHADLGRSFGSGPVSSMSSWLGRRAR